MKRVNNKKRHIHNNTSFSSNASMIKSLPRDLLVELVISVTSHSFLDLYNMKICCKDFLEATNDKYVCQKVSLDQFPFIQWFPNKKASTFLKICRESDNTESLFREGLQEYFSYPNKENIGALENLKMAMEKGHKEARYVYGMILLCANDDESRKQGLKHLRFLRKSKCVMSCRKKIRHLKSFLWKNNNGMLMCNINQTPLCNGTCDDGWRVKKDRWLLLDDEDDDISSCEYCRWDHEIESFSKLFD